MQPGPVLDCGGKLRLQLLDVGPEFVGRAVAAAAGIVDLRAQIGLVTLPVIGEVSSGGDINLRGLWASAQFGLALPL